MTDRLPVPAPTSDRLDAEPWPHHPTLRGAIFDFGGVMAAPVFRGHATVEAHLVGLVQFFMDESRNVYHLPTGSHDLHLLETGDISEREFFDRLCRRYAAAGNALIDPQVAQHAVFGRAMEACGAMVDAVRQIRAAGYRTALLTNISRDGEAVWSSLIPAGELFDTVVDSSKVKLRKPDRQIFLVTCERLGLKPQECLFIDDLECNVEAAEALGMEIIHCRDPFAVAEIVVRRLLGWTAAEEL